ncbi:MAG: PhzF family phenazine biosynthesis protein, partial [Anaerolineales bacterium]
YIVDVFAESKYAGNQLAVFRGPVPEALMQRLAREMNFAETTFITNETPRDGGYDVRIFTPNEEVPFAGHPTLGTAHILRTEVAPGLPEQVALNLKVGQIPVRFGDFYWMKQNPPEFRARLDAGVMAAVLGLDPGDIDGRFPIEEVSTGLPFIVVPLPSLTVLQRVRVNHDKYFALIANAWAKGLLVFCPEARSPENQFSVRVFVEYYGVPEDPATGSGNGCLAAYLVKHRYSGQAVIEARVEQGHQVGRPSLLHLKAADGEDGIRVEVGGQAITVAKGELVEEG